eukprot:252600-Prorocentrum_minimum.AAC.1
MTESVGKSSATHLSIIDYYLGGFHPLQPGFPPVKAYCPAGRPDDSILGDCIKSLATVSY